MFNASAWCLLVYVVLQTVVLNNGVRPWSFGVLVRLALLPCLVHMAECLRVTAIWTRAASGGRGLAAVLAVSRARDRGRSHHATRRPPSTRVSSRTVDCGDCAAIALPRVHASCVAGACETAVSARSRRQPCRVMRLTRVDGSDPGQRSASDVAVFLVLIADDDVVADLAA